MVKKIGSCGSIFFFIVNEIITCCLKNKNYRFKNVSNTVEAKDTFITVDHLN